MLVDRKALADQWRARMRELSGSRPASAAAAGRRCAASVDVAMLQTLARRDDVAELTGGYGLVVVDECHHIPAAAFEHAVKPDPRATLARPDRDPLPS